MANYPITSPTGGFRPSLQFPGAEAGLYEQLENFGRAGQNFFLQLHVQQADLQLNEALAKSEAEMLDLGNRIDKNADEDTYDSELLKTTGRINSFTPKNPLAAKEFRDWVQKQTPGWQDSVLDTKRRRMNAKKIAEIEALAAAGDVDKLEGSLDGAVKTRVIDEAQAGRIWRAAQEQAQKAGRQAHLDNLSRIGTDIALASPSTPGAGIEAQAARAHKWLDRQEGLSSAERAEVKRRIDGNINDQLIALERDKKDFALSVYDAPPTEPIGDVMGKIKDSTLDVPEQDALIRSVLFRREALATGQRDPLMSRYNTPLYWDLYQKGLDGTVDEPTLRKAVGYDPERPNETGITMTDYKEITNLLDKDFVVQNPVVKDGMDSVDKVVSLRLTAANPGVSASAADKKKFTDEQAPKILSQGTALKRQIYNTAQAHPEWTESQLMAEIDKIIAGGKEAVVTDIAERMGVLSRVKGSLRAPFLKDVPSIKPPTAIIKVNTIEEADALEPGTKFYDPDGVLRIR